MVKIRPKTLVNMHLEGVCPSDSRTDVFVRDLMATFDEQVERGGTNAGPSPSETLLSPLIAGTNRISRKIAKIQEDLPKFCPISRVMRETGTKIEGVWNVARR